MPSASIPKTMAGIVIEKTGGTEVLQYKTDLPVPVPKEGEVLIKNEYIGVNYIDTYQHPWETPESLLPPKKINRRLLTSPPPLQIFPHGALPIPQTHDPRP